MKRKGNLYENIYDFNNIVDAINEVCRNTKNRKKVEFFKEYKCTYISRIYNILKNENYVPGPYTVFIIYEPKERRIVSQGMIDKVINHLVASRKDMGTKRALELFQKYRTYFSTRYGTYYMLKCDISKFFASIDNDILK